MLASPPEPGTAALPPIEVDWSLGFLNSATSTALAYWQTRRGDRELPTRDDIRPSAMRTFLPNIALLEPLGPSAMPDDYLVRLAGSFIEQTFGRIGGRKLSEFLSPVFQQRWRRSFDMARFSRRPLRTSGRIAFQNKTWLMGETLVAPLGEEGEPVGMLLVAFAAWPESEAEED
jgi:hypothetical protein